MVVTSQPLFSAWAATLQCQVMLSQHLRNMQPEDCDHLYWIVNGRTLALDPQGKTGTNNTQTHVMDWKEWAKKNISLWWAWRFLLNNWCAWSHLNGCWCVSPPSMRSWLTSCCYRGFRRHCQFHISQWMVSHRGIRLCKWLVDVRCEIITRQTKHLVEVNT